jgi:predicted secreted protein
MLLKKTVLTVFIILFVCVSALWAGDTAVFVDLGFSQDGRTYMFGQYGVQSPSLRPWAEIFVVDVARNAFVQNGRASLVQNTPIRAGQDGSGTLHQLVSGNSSLASRHGINFQNQGQPLYISRDLNPLPNNPPISFRDFPNRKSYNAHLITTAQGFFIRLDAYNNLEFSGQSKRYDIGAPNRHRQGVVQYNIKRVIVDSSGNSLIFVIEMKRTAANGFDIRYMVETVRL